MVTGSKRAAQVLLPPDCRLGPAEFVELGGAQRRLGDREELVELRRRCSGAAEHRVRLAAMMDLMLEQVQQKAIGRSVCTRVPRCTRMIRSGPASSSVSQQAINRRSIAAWAGRRSETVGKGIGSAHAAGPSVPPSSASTSNRSMIRMWFKVA